MDEKQYLICDCVGSAKLEILTEATTNGTPELIIRGKFQEVDVQNKNKRIYPRGVLEPQVIALQEVIGRNGLIGELDHPTDSIIHFENASHIITKLCWEDNNLMGEARVLNTPSGKILEALVREGIQIGISSRGVGSGHMNREGITIINDGFRLITFDIVADPSTPGAFLSTESIESEPSETETDEETNEAPTQESETGAEAEETTSESTSTDVDTMLKPEIVDGFLKALFRAQF